ncbi:MAG: hypothetical protein ABI520_07065 [Caldimonas sp.]
MYRITMPVTSDPRRNQFLAALPPADWQRWSRRLERVELARGEVLKVSGHAMGHVYFPTTAIVTLTYLTEGSDSAGIECDRLLSCGSIEPARALGIHGLRALPLAA